MATKGQVHRHGAGRLPGGSAAGQPGVFGQRASGRRLGLAGAVPGQHLPGHRRADHPRQGARVTGVRGRQGARRHRQVPDRAGDQDRLAQHPARHRPAHRRDRRLRGVDHLHDLVSEERRAGHQIRDADRAVHRLGDRHRRHHGLGPAHRQDRPAHRLPVCLRVRGALRCVDVPAGQHRHLPADHRDLRVGIRAWCRTRWPAPRARWFPELFTANTRASGASLAYQISAMVSGFTPFITTLLFVSFGWIGPALLFSSYAAIGLAGGAGDPGDLGAARAGVGR